MRLGFIGCGNMGGAMVSGILKKQLLASEDMIASALHEESRKALRELQSPQTTLRSLPSPIFLFWR